MTLVAEKLETVPKPEMPVLGYEDIEWISKLTSEDISETWLQCANDLIPIGAATVQSDPRALSPETNYARSYFYEHLMGFSQPSSPIYDVYHDMAARRRELAPLNNFVDIMRIANQEKLDPVQLSKTFIESWQYPAPAFRKAIDDFRMIVGKKDAPDVLNKDARILAQINRQERFAGFFKMAHSLNWPREFVPQLFAAKPRVARLALPRLAVHARYFAHYGSADFTPAQVGNLLSAHPDKHLIALESGIPRYTAHYVELASKSMSPEERAEKVTSILTSPNSSQVIGEEVMRVHRLFNEAEKTKAGV